MDVTIFARNAIEGVTQNFHSGNSKYYENPVSVDMNVTDWNTSATLPHPNGNANPVIIKDIPTAQWLGFGTPDTNGTHTIPWNETNATQKLMFNYTRYNNDMVNPFIVEGNEVNLTVNSSYTSTEGAVEGTANIVGTEIGDQNATFGFARAKASKDFYDDVTTASIDTPITILVYCDLWVGCSNLGIDTINGQTDDNKWWLSWNHVEADGDGNITLVSPPTIMEGAGNPTVTTDVTVSTEGQDTTVNVTSGSTTLPMTVWIELDDTLPTDTNSWLIYNENSAFGIPSPFYKVRFIGTSGWSGVGETGHVLEINASSIKTKRLNW